MTAARIGRLLEGPVTTVVTQLDEFVAVALPRREESSGLVWRLAREVDSSVVRQISEADVGDGIVVVFETVGTGSASIVFA